MYDNGIFCCAQIQSDEFAREYEDYLAYCAEMEGDSNR